MAGTRERKLSSHLGELEFRKGTRVHAAVRPWLACESGDRASIIASLISLQGSVRSAGKPSQPTNHHINVVIS